MAVLDRALRLRQLSFELNGKSKATQASRVTFSALRSLGRSRPLRLKGLRLLKHLKLDPQGLHPKLRLWSVVAGDITTAGQQTNQVLTTLHSTDAWKQAVQAYEQRQQRQMQARWNHRGRLEDPDKLIKQLRQNPNAPLFFWHHYDRRGLIPRSWMAVLLAIRDQGWQVVVSSSKLAPSIQTQLSHQNIPCLLRNNIGLCLGAYRDFCCLLSESEDLLATRSHLVLANDSTLPIGGPQHFVQMLKDMASGQSDSSPQLNGLTDSIERDAYHLQSYLLLANAALIRNSSWVQFWNLFDLTGSKDNLIDSGELGLSQELLRVGVHLEAQHSLVGMLLNESCTNGELASFEIHELREINLSLYAWQTLLKSGCPLLKKKVLFELRPIPNVPIPLSELKTHLKEVDDDLRHDLEDLIRSRYLLH